MVAAPKRRRPRRTKPAEPVAAAQDVEVTVEIAEPPRLEIPSGVLTDAAGHVLTDAEAAALPLTKEEKDRISLAAALARAAEIEENDDRSVNGGDAYAFDRSIIPAGWEYQWRTDTVLGQKDPSYQVELQKMGWKPVPASRHPEMMPIGWNHEYIVRRGQILMEMPAAIVERARIMDKRRAMEAVRVKEDQLNSAGPNQFSRRGQTSRSFGPMEIPKA